MYFHIFICLLDILLKSLAKRKLEISDEKEVIVYTEDDGTEIDEDTFSAFDPGSTFICAVGNENWSPSTPQEESNTPGRLSSRLVQGEQKKNRQIYLLLLQRYSV